MKFWNLHNIVVIVWQKWWKGGGKDKIISQNDQNLSVNKLKENKNTKLITLSSGYGLY